MRYGVLGPLEVRDATGAVVEVRGERQRSVLAVLLLHAGKTVSADRLVDAVWGGDPPSDPTGALQTQLSRLRRSLGALPGRGITTEPTGWRLAVDPVEGPVTDEETGPGSEGIDATRFERLHSLAGDLAATDPAAAERLLGEALALWRGPAWAEFADRPWAQAEAVRLDDLRVTAAEDRAEALLALDRAPAAVAILEPLTTANPYRERPCSLLMRALYLSGRHADSLAAYRRFRTSLAEDLGLEPSDELRNLEGAVLRHEVPVPAAAGPTTAEAPEPGGRPHAGLPAHSGPHETAPPGHGDWPPPRPAPPPTPRTRLVGRDEDVTGVQAALGTARLVTVTGTGGVGKTRLALEVADVTPDDYPEGVHLVELAALPSAADVPAAVASSLGIRQRAGVSPLDRIAEALSSGRLLLVLDNCEHVLEGAAEVAEALLGTTGVDVLATSREPLGVEGEQLWPLSPLATPPATPDAAPAPAGIGEGAPSPALDLFCDRARAVLPGFSLDAGNRDAVTEICRRVDGIPLCIELAAARMRVVEPAELVRSLEGVAGEGDLGVLDAGRRRGAARHRSPTALVDWSYELLGEEERRLFARLAVFAGSFDTEDAVAIASDLPVTPESIPSVLWGLVDKSLVTRVPGSGTTRTQYTLLGPMREYGRNRLEDEGCIDAVVLRHAGHVLSVARGADEGMRGPDAPDAVRRLDGLLPELRAVHLRLSGRGDDDAVDILLDLAISLHFWAMSRMQSEAFDWTTETTRVAAGTADPRVALALGSASLGAVQRGDLDGARRLANDSLAAVERSGVEASARFACDTLGDLGIYTGDTTDAVSWYRRSRDLGGAAGDDLHATIAGSGLAIASALNGDPAEAVAAADAALGTARDMGSACAEAWAHFAEGEIRAETDPDVALVHLDEAIVDARKVHDRFLLGVGGLTATSLRARGGDTAGAIDAFPWLLDHWRRLGAWTQQWTTLRIIAETLARVGEDRTAARLLGALDSSVRAPSAYGPDARRLRAAEESVSGRLGESTYRAEREAGAALDDEEAVTLALSVLEGLSPGN